MGDIASLPIPPGGAVTSLRVPSVSDETPEQRDVRTYQAGAPEFAKGLRSSVNSAFGAVNALAAAGGSALGMDDFAASRMAAAEEDVAFSEAVGPRVRDVQSIGGVGDAVEFVSGLMGETAGFLAPMAVAGGAGALAGGLRGAAITAGASMLPVETGGQVLRTKDAPGTLGSKLPSALGVGAVNTALGLAVPVGGAGRIAAGRAGKALAEGAGATAAMGGVGAGMEAVRQGAHTSVDPGRDKSGDDMALVNMGVAGAAAGLPIGLGLAAGRALTKGKPAPFETGRVHTPEEIKKALDVRERPLDEDAMPPDDVPNDPESLGAWLDKHQAATADDRIAWQKRVPWGEEYDLADPKQGEEFSQRLRQHYTDTVDKPEIAAQIDSLRKAVPKPELPPGAKPSLQRTALDLKILDIVQTSMEPKKLALLTPAQRMDLAEGIKDYVAHTWGAKADKLKGASGMRMPNSIPDLYGDGAVEVLSAVHEVMGKFGGKPLAKMTGLKAGMKRAAKARASVLTELEQVVEGSLRQEWQVELASRATATREVTRTLQKRLDNPPKTREEWVQLNAILDKAFGENADYVVGEFEKRRKRVTRGWEDMGDPEAVTKAAVEREPDGREGYERTEDAGEAAQVEKPREDASDPYQDKRLGVPVEEKDLPHVYKALREEYDPKAVQFKAEPVLDAEGNMTGKQTIRAVDAEAKVGFSPDEMKRIAEKHGKAGLENNVVTTVRVERDFDGNPVIGKNGNPKVAPMAVSLPNLAAETARTMKFSGKPEGAGYVRALVMEGLSRLMSDPDFVRFGRGSADDMKAGWQIPDKTVVYVEKSGKQWTWGDVAAEERAATKAGEKEYWKKIVGRLDEQVDNARAEVRKRMVDALADKLEFGTAEKRLAWAEKKIGKDVPLSEDSYLGQYAMLKAGVKDAVDRLAGYDYEKDKATSHSTGVETEGAMLLGEVKRAKAAYNDFVREHAKDLELGKRDDANFERMTTRERRGGTVEHRYYESERGMTSTDELIEQSLTRERENPPPMTLDKYREGAGKGPAGELTTGVRDKGPGISVVSAEYPTRKDRNIVRGENLEDASTELAKRRAARTGATEAKKGGLPPASERPPRAPVDAALNERLGAGKAGGTKPATKEGEAQRTKALSDRRADLVSEKAKPKLSEVRVGKDAMDEATKAQVRAHVEKVLGPKARVLFKEMERAGSFLSEAFGKDGYETLTVALRALDPKSVGFHESLHGLIARLATDDPRAANILKEAADSPTVMAQMRRLLKDEPEALKQLSDPEERAAYMYQFWANDQLRLGPKTEGVFNKIKALLKAAAHAMLGVGDDPLTMHQADAILQAFHNGELANRSAAGRVLDRIAPPDQMQGHWIGRIAETAERVFESSNGYVRGMKIPAFSGAADKLFRHDGGEIGFRDAHRTQYYRFLNVVSDATRGMDETQQAAVMASLRGDKSVALSANERAAAKMLETVLREAHDYMVKKGVKAVEWDSQGKRYVERDLGRVENYFPRVFDRDAIRADMAGFEALLKKHGVEEPSEVASKLLSDNKVSPDDSDFTAGLSFFAPETLPRQLKIPDAELAPYLRKDLTSTLMTYLNHVTRRAEWTERFGNQSQGIEAAIAEGVAQGATPAQVKGFTDFVKAHDGSLGSDLDPKIRQFMSGVMTYQHYRLLPLALMSNIIDPLGIGVRGGGVDHAFKAFTRGLRDLVSTKNDEGREFARSVGAIADASDAHTTSEQYNINGASGFMKKANDLLFKYNGMESWNNSVRTQAAVAARDFVIKHAKGVSEHSERYLQELGLTKDDVRVADGKLELTPVVVDAINRWVDGAVLRPGPSIRPIYMSDPHFMLVSDLNHFAYALQTVITRRMAHEVANGNYKPAMVLASYVPAIIAADVMRAVITPGGGDDERFTKWGVMDWLVHGIHRAGLSGPGQNALNAGTDLSYRQPIKAAASMLGPTAQQGADLLAAMSSDKPGAMAHEAFRALPFTTVLFPGGKP